MRMTKRTLVSQLRLRLPSLSNPRQGRQPGRRIGAAVLAVIIVVPVIVGGLWNTKIETGVNSFLPDTDPAAQQYNHLAQSFGGDPIVVTLESQHPETLQSGDQVRRDVQLEGQLSQLPDAAAVYGPGTVLNQVAGQSQDLLAELTGRREALRNQAKAQAKQQGSSDSAAVNAANGATAQFDQRYGSLLVEGMPAGLPTLHNDRFIHNVIYGQGQNPRPQWKFVVPSKNSVAILVRPRQGLDQNATEQLVHQVRSTVHGAKLNTSRTTVSGVPAIVSAIGAQVRDEIPLIGGAACILITLCFLLVPWTRGRNRILPMIAALTATGLTLASFGWLGRPLSIGVLAFIPVLLGVGSYYTSYLVRHTKTTLVGVVALATSLSFGALLLSPMPFVRDLGITLSVGILFAYTVGWFLVRYVAFPAGEAEQRIPQPPRWVMKTSTLGKAPAGLTVRKRRTRSLVVALVAAGGWLALPVVPLQSDFENFSAGVPASKDVEHVKDVLGSSGEVDVVLTGNDVASPAAMAWMQKAQDVLITKHGDQLRPIVSPPTLLSFLNGTANAQQIQAGLRLLPSYLVDSVIRNDHHVAVLSYGVKTEDAQQLKTLRDSIVTSLPPPPEGYTRELSGLPMLAAHGYDLVSASRYLANLAGVVAAGLVLAIGLKRRDALRAVAAALIATGAGLFLVWIAGLALNPITVALGSLTAAIASEFTVLLIEARRRDSMALGISVAMATVTSAIGYGVLGLSSLHAMQEFGALLAGSVMLSLLASHFVVSMSETTKTDAGDLANQANTHSPSPTPGVKE